MNSAVFSDCNVKLNGKSKIIKFMANHNKMSENWDDVYEVVEQKSSQNVIIEYCLHNFN